MVAYSVWLRLATGLVSRGRPRVWGERALAGKGAQSLSALLAFALVALFVPVVPAAEAAQDGFPAMIRFEDYAVADSAARFDALLRDAAMRMESTVRVRLVGDWATSAGNAMEQVNFFNWMSGYTIQTLIREGELFLSIEMKPKDSVRMLAASRNPALLPKLSRDERAALAVVQKALGQVIRPGMPDMEKIQAVHDYIITRSHYDLEIPNRQEATTLILHRRGVCDAYSRTAWLMLNMLGIPCIQVIGDSQGPHSWNMVYALGQWFHLDLTWDDPICTPEILSYSYFCVSDKHLSRTHKWNARLYPPTKDSPPLYYLHHHRYFTAVNDAFWRGAREAYLQGAEVYETYIENLSDRDSIVRQINEAHARSNPPIRTWSISRENKGMLRLTFVPRRQALPADAPAPKETLFELPTGGMIDVTWLMPSLPGGTRMYIDVDKAQKAGRELMEKGSELWNEVRGLLP